MIMAITNMVIFTIVDDIMVVFTNGKYLNVEIYLLILLSFILCFIVWRKMKLSSIPAIMETIVVMLSSLIGEIVGIVVGAQYFGGWFDMMIGGNSNNLIKNISAVQISQD